MAKRIYKSDSPSLRKRVKNGKVNKDQLQGAALAYYNRVQGAAKARKKKVEAVAKIGDFEVPRDSRLYGIIKKAAEIKGISVKEFTEQYGEALLNLSRSGNQILDRETDRLIGDIRRSGKGTQVFINDGDGFVHVGKMRAMLHLQEFNQYVLGSSDIFLLFFRTEYKLTGDLYFYLPSEQDYDQYDGEDLELYLDDWYPNIGYVKSAKQAE